LEQDGELLVRISISRLENIHARVTMNKGEYLRNLEDEGSLAAIVE
jgi:hypothetical protein